MNTQDWMSCWLMSRSRISSKRRRKCMENEKEKTIIKLNSKIDITVNKYSLYWRVNQGGYSLNDSNKRRYQWHADHACCGCGASLKLQTFKVFS